MSWLYLKIIFKSENCSSGWNISDLKNRRTKTSQSSPGDWMALTCGKFPDVENGEAVIPYP